MDAWRGATVQHRLPPRTGRVEEFPQAERRVRGVHLAIRIRAPKVLVGESHARGARRELADIGGVDSGVDLRGPRPTVRNTPQPLVLLGGYLEGGTGAAAAGGGASASARSPAEGLRGKLRALILGTGAPDAGAALRGPRGVGPVVGAPRGGRSGGGAGYPGAREAARGGTKPEGVTEAEREGTTKAEAGRCPRSADDTRASVRASAICAAVNDRPLALTWPPRLPYAHTELLGLLLVGDVNRLPEGVHASPETERSLMAAHIASD
eukprot:1181694-Prorocentrum_minimum.AAC.2